MDRSIIQGAREHIADVEYALSAIRANLLNELNRSKNEDKQKDRAFSLIETIKANVDNDKLSDAAFREFIRRSIK